MLLQKYLKSRRKLKIILLFFVIVLIAITVILLNGSTARRVTIKSAYNSNGRIQEPPLLKSPQQNGVIVPEKYDEHKIKARIIRDKIKDLRQQHQHAIDDDDEELNTAIGASSSSVHIFYSASVPWYKAKKIYYMPQETINEDNKTGDLLIITPTIRPLRMLNTAFYPALGLYKATVALFKQHFNNIRNCGIAVLIFSFSVDEQELYHILLDLAPRYNLSITFELSVAGNQSVEYLRQQLHAVDKLANAFKSGFFRVYSQSREKFMPLVYVSSAYKLGETLGRLLCHGHLGGLRHSFDAFYIGHIRLKNHADIMRHLCFDGFYSKLPSNGATFSSTWKNWPYLKSFALTYKMLFVPTVGPGFAERNKFPRHTDVQRHRSNGRYYGVAWRTAILNHVGFISVASYNNWPDGSQIEEAIPRPGFLDYSPGSSTKYLDLTAHWVGNFLKTRQEAANLATSVGGLLNCYELLNNTIC